MRFIYDLDHTVIDSSHRAATLPNGSIDLDHWREHSTPELIARDRLLPLASIGKFNALAALRLSSALLALWAMRIINISRITV